MAFKARVLVPGAAAAAAMTLLVACPPPPPPPPPPESTTTPIVTDPPACPATPHSAAGPDGSDPIPSWGVDGTAIATAVVGDIVYVGGQFNNAISPTGATAPRANLAAFCLADGSLLSTFSANFAGGPVKALATDGTSLFVGGNFTTLNGAPSNRLVKLNALTGVGDTGFSPDPIPAPQATPPAILPDGVLALAYSSATGVLYAGGDFGKIGTGAGMGQSTIVDNAAGFNANGSLTSFTGGADKKVEAIAVSPDGQSVFLGGGFTSVHGTARGQLARLDPAGAVLSPSYGSIGGHVADIVATSGQDIAVAVGVPIAGSGTGHRFVTFTGATQVIDDTNPKGNVNAVEVIGGRDFFGMFNGYAANTGANIVGVDPSQAVGSPSYIQYSARVGGVFDLAQSTGGARLVAVGGFSTGGLHGLAIFP